LHLDPSIVLYHGTTEDAAEALLKGGWKPGLSVVGANQGQPRLLYLTNVPENALWFAQEKGGSTVLEVRVPLDYLIVDPEDGIGDDVADEFEKTRQWNLPACLASWRPLPAGCFAPHDPAPTPGRP